MANHEIVRDLGGDSAHEEVTLSAATVGSEIVFTGDGKAGVIISTKDNASGDTVAVSTEALVWVVAASATTFAAGEVVALNTSTKLAVTDGSSGSRRIGLAVTAKTNGQTFVLVRLNGQRNAPEHTQRSIRRRCTTAEINAGVTVLPALTGYKYRVTDMKMIAIGGGAATATSVDILATQSASSVKLMASAVAGLTQSAVLRAGAANAAVLADGASFVANDSGTAITVGKTGSALATATAVDVFIDYVVEAG